MIGPAGERVICPHCESEVEVPGDVPEPACPACGALFSLPSTSSGAQEQTPERPELDPRRLDDQHIRRVAALRRAADRARSHAIIAASLFGIAGIQCAAWAIVRVRSVGPDLLGIVFLLATALTIVASVYFVRKAAAFHRTARQADHLPAAPPDFSTLDSDRAPWEKLHDVR